MLADTGGTSLLRLSPAMEKSPAEAAGLVIHGSG
jgi:hypothetical protein